jgi:hypothetical protein
MGMGRTLSHEMSLSNWVPDFFPPKRNYHRVPLAFLYFESEMAAADDMA